MIIDERRGRVVIGEGAMIDDTAIIIGPCEIGEEVAVGPYCVIGGDPEHTRSKCSVKPVEIQVGTVLREAVTVHRGIMGGPGTIIGEDCYIQRGVHVAHDCTLGRCVTLANNVCLGGTVQIQRFANLGMGATVHQFVTIGACAMVGMGAAVISAVRPGAQVAGVPARDLGPDTIGSEPSGVTADDLADLEMVWNQIRKR